MGSDGGALWDARTQWNVGFVPQGISADLLAQSGVAARVVSVPCLELFEEQGDDYVESLVPDDGTQITVDYDYAAK